MTNKKERIYIEVSKDNSSINIIKFLQKKFTNLSYVSIFKLIKKGDIRVNGKRIKDSYSLESGDIIKLPPFIDEVTSITIPKKKKDINENIANGVKNNILYKDEDILVINKPAGLAVQGGTAVVNHIDGLLERLKFEKEESPMLVHRLDKETSGVLVLARTARAAKYLFQNFKNRAIKKTYVAIAEGEKGINVAKSGVIDLPLLKGSHEKMEVNSEGKEALSYYKILKNKDNLFMVEVSPVTGRTHQIRAHLKYGLNLTIVGDYKYGYKRKNIDFSENRLYLHAKTIKFINLDGSEVIINAEADQSFKLLAESFSI